ncbi:MAG: HNH endonuclease [Bacteroidales bacterium]|nr:HNH endonuclease [Bacteroidales bacterium]
MEACHIIGWAEDRELRTDPCNGLCMNVFFHRAYDNHLMGITPDGIIHISPTLIDNVSEENFKSYLVKLENRKIHMPSHFYPNPDYLAARYEQFGKA